MAIAFSNKRAALVIAHPGHELRVYQWLRLTRPLCFILTDGSGRSGKSRLDSTTKLLEQNGAQVGSIYGRLTDYEIYAAIIKGEFDLFVKLTEELSRELVRAEIEYVVGDAFEGYNPVHDVCRLMINAALETANRTVKHSILNFEILLTTDPTDYPKSLLTDAIRLNLDEDDLAKKQTAVHAYAEIAADVDRILQREGVRGIQTELLRSVSNCLAGDGVITEPPYYEIHGEKQVAAGYYEHVLRYREHVLPIAQALRHYSHNNGSRVI